MLAASTSRMKLRTLFLGMIIVGAGTACVSQGKYDRTVADAAKAAAEARSTRAALQQQLARRDNELNRLQQVMSEAEARCANKMRELETLESAGRNCTQALDEATAMNQQLRSELEKQGKNVDALLSAKGALSSSLQQAQARLTELRKAQAAAEARAALFRDLALRLKRMIDAGELKIVLRSGRMVLVMPNDVLFDSGKTAIKPNGKEAVGEVARVLASLPERRFQVAGHTDNEPIRVSGFTSNWELSTERALGVVTLLIASGMKPESLSAAGYGEFDPVRPNDSVENKAHNRRTEITLQPSIDELVAIPETR
jgi:chemotaxis protein MotB